MLLTAPAGSAGWAEPACSGDFAGLLHKGSKVGKLTGRGAVTVVFMFSAHFRSPQVANRFSLLFPVSKEFQHVHSFCLTD